MNRLVAIFFALFALPGAAGATAFRLPLEGCDPSVAHCDMGTDTPPCYATAYVDMDVRIDYWHDWTCNEANTYDEHLGSDYGIGGFTAMDAGSRTVVAGAAGQVVEVLDGKYDRNTSLDGDPDPGNYVALRHADGKHTVYMHMMKDSVLVRLGDQVTCGQTLGRVGSSGHSNGPHLHFEVDMHGVLVDADDPFAASDPACGGNLSFWNIQGAYCSLPSTCCEGGCDDALYTDETIPDGTWMQPNESFDKTWTFTNIGGTTWSGSTYRLAFVRGDQLGAPPLVSLSAGESVSLDETKVWTVPMRAPAASGRFRGTWSMDHAGVHFGDEVWVEIVVDTAQPPDDADGDGHGSLASGGDDCDDTDPEVYPGHIEACDSKDNDCNDLVDDDGTDEFSLVRSCVSACGTGTEVCSPGGVFTGCTAPTEEPESCDGQDNDCDGTVDNGALCSQGFVCTGGACIDPGQGTVKQDAGPSGTGKPIEDGACGCSTASSALPAAALLLAGLLRRRRR